MTMETPWDLSASAASARMAFGANIQIDENARTIVEKNHCGEVEVISEFSRISGTLCRVDRFTDGRLDDGQDGTPAHREFYRSGSLRWAERYLNGVRTDSHGSPAVLWLDHAGAPKAVQHWTDGHCVATWSRTRRWIIRDHEFVEYDPLRAVRASII